MNQYINGKNLRIAVVILICILGSFIIYSIVTAVLLKQRTAAVAITSSDPSAVLTISQTNTEAAQVGIGESTIRLKPGSYYVLAYTAGKSTGKTVEVKGSQENTVYLDLEEGNEGIKTAQSLTYIGFDKLLDNGLSTQQVNNTKQLFYESNKSAMSVTINTTSVTPSPRDPTNINFSLTFTGLVDGTVYKAKLVYSGLDFVKLTLQEPNGKTTYVGELPYSAAND